MSVKSAFRPQIIGAFRVFIVHPNRFTVDSMAETIKALIWCAVSSKEQAKSDKISLQLQERLAREVCTQRGWEVIEPPLRMAHSRDYTDLSKWAASLQRDGNSDGYRLFEMWETKGFDVLICHTPDRLGYSASMMARVVEDTIRADAWIYCIEGMHLDQHNYAALLAMYMYATRARMTHLKQKREEQLDIRASQGKHIGKKPTFSHIVTPTGEIVVNPDNRAFFRQGAKYLLEGLDIMRIERRMFDQDGIGQVGENGELRPYPAGNFYLKLHRPVTWGHTVRHFNHTEAFKSHPRWVYDETVPLPEGVKLWRNTFPGVYDDDPDLKQKVIFALNYRHDVTKGGSGSEVKYALSGCLICSRCGYRMVAEKLKNALYWRCSCYASKGYRRMAESPSCEAANQMVRDDALRSQIDEFLVRLKEAEQPDLLFVSTSPDQPDQRAELLAEIARQEKRLDRITSRLLEFDDDPEMQRSLEKQRKPASAALAAARKSLQALDSERESESILADRAAALRSLKTNQWDDRWTRPAPEINQFLHQLLGDYRFAVDAFGKRIAGIAPKRFAGRKPNRKSSV